MQGDETLIERAFRHGTGEGRCVIDFKQEGSDQLKVDDFCLVIVRAKVANTPPTEKNSKPSVFMIICKFSAFSDTSRQTQLDMFIDRDQPYRARVLVLPVVDYFNSKTRNAFVWLPPSLVMVVFCVSYATLNLFISSLFLC